LRSLVIGTAIQGSARLRGSVSSVEAAGYPEVASDYGLSLLHKH
jgi:hypothetical protein